MLKTTCIANRFIAPQPNLAFKMHRILKRQKGLHDYSVLLTINLWVMKFKKKMDTKLYQNCTIPKRQNYHTYTYILSNVKGNVVGDMPRGWAELKGHIIAQT